MSQPPSGLEELLIGYGRGLAGGLLFGLPMLFTMEIWHEAFLMEPTRLVSFLLLQMIVLLGLVWVSGFKKEQEITFRQVGLESIETLGLALLESAFILFLIGQITANMSGVEIAGKIILEAIPVSMGIAIATSQLGVQKQGEQGQADGGSGQGQASDGSGQNQAGGGSGGAGVRTGPIGILRTYTTVMGGAFYLGYNFAPVQEITVIASGLDWWRLFTTMVLSLAVTFGLVFALDVQGGVQTVRGAPLLERPWVETLVAYVVSLGVAALLLFFFRAIPFDSLPSVVDHVVVLGLPCSLGAAAGRLLI